MRRWIYSALALLLVAVLLGGCGDEKGTEGLEYEAAGEGWVVTGYSGTASEVVIPDTHEGVPVTALGKAAFENSDIESIVIGCNVSEIGDRAFSGSVRLRSVDFAGDSLRLIGSLAFSGCTALSELTIPAGVTEVGACAFFRFKPEQHLTIRDSTDGWAVWWQDDCGARVEWDGQTALPE